MQPPSVLHFMLKFQIVQGHEFVQMLNLQLFFSVFAALNTGAMDGAAAGRSTILLLSLLCWGVFLRQGKESYPRFNFIQDLLCQCDCVGEGGEMIGRGALVRDNQKNWRRGEAGQWFVPSAG